MSYWRRISEDDIRRAMKTYYDKALSLLASKVSIYDGLSLISNEKGALRKLECIVTSELRDLNDINKPITIGILGSLEKYLNDICSYLENAKSKISKNILNDLTHNTELILMYLSFSWNIINRKNAVYDNRNIRDAFLSKIEGLFKKYYNLLTKKLKVNEYQS